MRTTFFFYFDATRIAFQSIFAHKLRSFLTLIGIIIGVASVVLVGAAIKRTEHLRVEQRHQTAWREYVLCDAQWVPLAVSPMKNGKRWSSGTRRSNGLKCVL